MIKLNKKGQIAIYIMFIILAIIIVIIGAVFAPMGVLFTTEAFHAGEGIINDTADTIASINNSDVRASVQNIYDSAGDNAANNIEILGDVYKYSWIIVLVLGGLITFLFTRRLVEYGGGGGFV